MGFLHDVVAFERNKIHNAFGLYKKDPERIALGGINTPAETKLWGKITGKDYQPTIDMYGGATQSDYQTAADKGINTKAGGTMHTIARTIVQIFAMKAATGGGAEGGEGAGASEGADANITGGTETAEPSSATPATDMSTSPDANISGDVHTGQPGILNRAMGAFRSMPSTVQRGLVENGSNTAEAALTPDALDVENEKMRQQRQDLITRNTNVGDVNVGGSSAQPLRDADGNLVFPVARTGFVRDAKGNLIPQDISPSGFAVNALAPR